MCFTPISQGYIIKSSMLGANIQFLDEEDITIPLTQTCVHA